MKKEYKSFKDLPTPTHRDPHHVLHLTAEFNMEIQEVIYTVKLECYLTKTQVPMLVTVVERDAHRLLRERANYLKCKWVDHTRGDDNDSRPSTTS